MRVKAGLGVLEMIFWCLLSVAYPAFTGAAAPEKADKEGILSAYANLPLYFIENKGQLDPKVRFYVKTSGQTLYFTDKGIVFDLFRGGERAKNERPEPEKGLHEAGQKRERLVFNLTFENVKEGVLTKGFDPQEAGINYFVGNDKSKWRTEIPTYKGIVYKGVYEGIDLKVFGNGKDMEYEFIVNPGGNSDQILLTYSGIEGLAVNEAGQLLIGTAFGQIEETKPHIYQEIEGKKEVDGRFEIRSCADPSDTGKFSYGFQVASYDPAYPLVIDPTLDYSTYLGGSRTDQGNGIAVDGYGNAYVTGETWSSDFPIKNPFQATFSGFMDSFIAKLSPAGNALFYSTYLGGSSSDEGNGIVVDGYGNAYVTGETRSTDFPTKNPFQATNGGWDDAFITKISSSGSDLYYSTYLGGNGSDAGYGIALDGSGNAYITGGTGSTVFPTKSPFQATNGGVSDAFITKISSSGRDLCYSTYLGGNWPDRAYGIAVDGHGNAYVTGVTYSSDFPTKNPFQATLAGYSAFVAKLTDSPSPIPTLNERGLIALSLLVILIGYFTIRKRRQA